MVTHLEVVGEEVGVGAVEGVPQCLPLEGAVAPPPLEALAVGQ